MPGTAHDDDKPGQLTGAAVVRDAERGYPAGRGIVAELQEALLPTALPVLPWARIAARYEPLHELDADLAAAERVCQLTVELLTRTGHTDDVTALAAQWLAEPVPPLHLSLPSARSSLTTARDAFAGWLNRLDAAADNADALHLAMVEVFTNAIEHAYPRESPGTVELDAAWTSAGVRVLYEVSKQLAAHGQKLTLVTARGSAAHLLLDLVRLDHVTAEEGA